MKLYVVRYTSGYGCEQSYLTVGEDYYETYKRERERITTQQPIWLVQFIVKEVNEVDGYKISVTSKEDTAKGG